MIPLAEAYSVAVLWGYTICLVLVWGAANTGTGVLERGDEDELKSGKSRPALFFALLTTTISWVLRLQSVQVFLYSVVIGFVPGGDNSQPVWMSLLLTYTLGAIIGLLAAWLPMTGYPLTKDVHADIREQLEARS